MFLVAGNFKEGYCAFIHVQVYYKFAYKILKGPLFYFKSMGGGGKGIYTSLIYT